jgi:hypothetical protein
VEKTEVPESKFAVGDIVRSCLKRPTWKKGYKQIWTERTPVIKEINGVRAKLKGNDEWVRLDDLQLVPSGSPSDETDVVGDADRVHKEGFDPTNIIEPRLRTQPVMN